MSESSGEDRIICRQCGENIAVRAGNCPHCGTSVRKGSRLLGAVVLGIGLILFSLYGIVLRGETGLWFFAIIGAAIAVVGYVLYDDRSDRIQEAEEDRA